MQFDSTAICSLLSLSQLREYGLSYLSLRACIGLWTAFLCLLLVATDASSLVCYITRFTEEAFASLICIIFIYEALEKLIYLEKYYPFNRNNNLDKLTTYSYAGRSRTTTVHFFQGKSLETEGLLGHPDVHVFPQMFMLRAF